MGYEIAYTVGNKPTDADILRTLREQNPDKDFALHNGTIVESYKTQPDFDEMLRNSRWPGRAQNELGVLAAAAANADDLDRMMSNKL